MMIPIQNTGNVTYKPMEVVSHRTGDILQKSRRGSTLLFRMLLSLPLMGLFTEWLYPLQSISNRSLSASLIYVLCGLTALLLLTGIFRWRVWISIPLQLILTIGSWMFLCTKDRELEWLISYGYMLRRDVVNIIRESSLSTISAETQTLILIIGWSLLVSTVQSLALDRSSIGLFASATLIYLFSLETLLELEVYADIVCATILLLILIGSLSLTKHHERSSTSSALLKRRYAGWFISVCVVALITVGIAWMAGRLITPEPAHKSRVQVAVKTIEDWSGKVVNRQGTQSAVTGYGTGEGDLGIPLQTSNELVFTAETPVPTYWRGETFGYYDGRRWTEPQVYFQEIDMKSQLRDSYSALEKKTKSIVQTISFNPPMTDEFPLFSGGYLERILDITTMNGERAIYMVHDGIADTVKISEATGPISVKSYQIEVTTPSINVNVLSKSTGLDPESVTKRYLQLPAELPLRVKQLGEEMTSKITNRYDSVLAVQSFLENNYKYSLHTSVPPANQDFVDNFLFQTKVGYCNHFSTSMVILLRSQGIPSRLVKGYAPGTLEKGSESTYVIKSLNAHSWVEVYFPQMGWVAFDPTPGFSMLQEKSEPLPLANHDVEDDGIRKSIVDFYTTLVRIIDNVLFKIRMIIFESGYIITGLIIVTTLVIASLLSAWGMRKTLFLWRLRFITRKTFPQKGQLLKAARIVWEEVGRRFGSIPMGITVREYVFSINDKNLQEELLLFVEQWEVIAYGEKLINRAHSITFLQRCSRLIHSL
jgi:transglutaminase-like putative cysteine protease